MSWLSEARVVKRREAVERWKSNNRERYLQQKRELSARPAYKQHRREMYHANRQELIEQGLLPKKLGRPQLYTEEQASERKRQRARYYASRLREQRSADQAEISLPTEDVNKIEEASEV